MGTQKWRTLEGNSTGTENTAEGRHASQVALAAGLRTKTCTPKARAFDGNHCRLVLAPPDRASELAKKDIKRAEELRLDIISRDGF